jgi:hypothetical protein
MSTERVSEEPPRDYSPLAVRSGVTYKPFEDFEDFYRFIPEDRINHNKIAETYDHYLLLRRRVMFMGINGYIDIISEDPAAMFQIVLPGRTCEKPLGETYFMFAMYVKNDPENLDVDENPYTLRFSFFLNSPRNYSRLLESQIDVKLGEEKYSLFWALQRKKQKKILRRLEFGARGVRVSEKNLFNQRLIGEAEIEGEFESDELSNEDIGRSQFIWLPEDLEKLKTIEVTFLGDDDSSSRKDSELPTNPHGVLEPALA